VIDADLTSVIGGGATRLEDIEIGEREPMVLIIVGEKGEGRVFVHHLGLKDVAVPGNHLIKAPRLIDDVRKLHGLYHCRLPLKKVSRNATAKLGLAAITARK
jgi:hypothetical protein